MRYGDVIGASVILVVLGSIAGGVWLSVEDGKRYAEQRRERERLELLEFTERCEARGGVVVRIPKGFARAAYNDCRLP